MYIYIDIYIYTNLCIDSLSIYLSPFLQDPHSRLLGVGHVAIRRRSEDVVFRLTYLVLRLEQVMGNVLVICDKVVFGLDSLVSKNLRDNKENTKGTMVAIPFAFLAF